MSTTPLKIYLTDEQKHWIETKAEEKNTTLSKFLVSLLEAEMDGTTTERELKKLDERLARIESHQKNSFEDVIGSQVACLAYVKELFRESAANLYRLNAVIEDMPDALSVRQSLNRFVREKEKELQEKVAEFHAEVSHG
jgi:septal ring factor EnvC (AmiA/AmiB activator)